MASNTASIKATKLKKPGGTWKHDLMMNWKIYILIIPVIIYFIIFNYLPMGGIIMAFQDFSPAKGFFGSDLVGFKHFITFFTAPNFFTILRNTFVISFLGLAIGFPASIAFALFLNEISVTFFKKTVQTISYMPYFVSTVVICGLIIDFVSSHGVVTNFLVLFGFDRQNLLLNPNYFWAINLASDMWQSLGYGSIIFIAAIAGVSQELYEAAAIDGATRWDRVLHITIPGIMPTIMTMFILRCGLLMVVGFDKILLLYNPSIFETADVISTNVQRLGIEKAQYGYSAAVGLFNSIVGTSMLVISNVLSKKLTDHSIM